MSSEQNINVNDLVNKYNSFSSQSAKDNYLKTVVKPTGYHGFAAVCVEADGIIKSSCYDKSGNLHIDSCRKYINYVFTILRFYTNLEVNEDDFVHEYDTLNELGLIDKIVKLVPEQYIKTLDSILDMKMQDVMTNEYDIHQYVNKQLARLYPHIEKPLDNIISALNNAINKIDPKTVAKILSFDENKN